MEDIYQHRRLTMKNNIVVFNVKSRVITTHYLFIYAKLNNESKRKW